jgi:hypothetical protein
MLDWPVVNLLSSFTPSAMVETNFEVKPLPKARIPIIKLTLQPSPGLPYGEYEIDPIVSAYARPLG